MQESKFVFSCYYQTILLALTLLSVANSFAEKSSADFAVSGTVPIVMQASASRVSESMYRVHEISNCGEGYVVLLETDATSIHYNGNKIQVDSGQAILTQIFSQEKSIDVFKDLELASKASFVRVSIQAN